MTKKIMKSRKEKREAVICAMQCRREQEQRKQKILEIRTILNTHYAA